MGDTTVQSKRPRTRRQHGTGSILELAPDRFRLGYEANAPGEPRRQRFEVFRGSKNAAKHRLATLIEQARKGGAAGDDALTFGELADRFLKDKRISGAGTTVHLYTRTLRCHVLPVIGKIKARRLNAAQITTLILEAKDVSHKKTNGRLLSQTYRGSLRTLISSVLEYGVKQDVLIRNVAKMVAVPAPAHREHVKFTREDVTIFIEASKGTPLHAIITFAIGTGLRRGEICGLKWSDVDMETGEYTLQRSAKNLDGKAILGKMKTAKSARTDQLPAFVMRALKEHRAQQMERYIAIGIRPGDEGFVFDRPDGSMIDPNELSRWFHHFVRAKGLRLVRFHDLRHGFATLAFSAGVSLKTISESLGHSSLAVTSSVYVDVIDEAKREKANVIDRYLSEAVYKGQRAASSEIN